MSNKQMEYFNGSCSFDKHDLASFMNRVIKAVNVVTKRVDSIERFLREHTAPDKPPLGSLSATTKAKESEDMAKQAKGSWLCSECGMVLPLDVYATGDGNEHSYNPGGYLKDAQKHVVEWIDTGAPAVEKMNPAKQPEGRWICRACGNATSHPAPSNKYVAHYRNIKPSCGYCG